MPETTPPPRAAFAPWDRRQLPGLFDVEESARRVGHYKWVEMRLFEVLGGWVATVPELDIKMRLGTHCYHHAWHSELWHKRLPELREMNPDRLCVPPNDALVIHCLVPETCQPRACSCATYQSITRFGRALAGSVQSRAPNASPGVVFGAAEPG